MARQKKMITTTGSSQPVSNISVSSLICSFVPADHIVELMEQKSLSQKALAKRMGMTESELTDWKSRMTEYGNNYAIG